MEDKKEHIRQYKKKYREENKDKIQAYRKLYRIINREKMNEKIMCEQCGSTLYKRHMNRHLKSNKHINFSSNKCQVIE